MKRLIEYKYNSWTETTWSYNIGEVKIIYERNGGVLV